jgi:hypothetical protein
MRIGALPSVRKARTFNPMDAAFPAQQAAILDTSTFIAITTSGRAGKTTAASLKWHHTRVTKPGCTSIFVALSGKHAKAILWTELKKQNREWGLGLSFNESDLVVTDAQGSTLYLLGANRDDLVDTLRGFPLVLCIFDEAAFVRRGLLERCVDEAINIRLLDYGGQVWTISTPGYLKSGWFYRVSSGLQPGWSRHRWSIYDNPHIPKDPSLSVIQKYQAKVEWIEKQREAKGWTFATPGFQREFLGEWAHDEESLVYPVTDRNLIQRMPDSWYSKREQWHTVIAVDYGVTNPTAHSLWAWNDYEHTAYLVRSRQDPGLDGVAAAEITQQWIADESPVVCVGDGGGLGKTYILTANDRFSLAIEPADKIGKRGHQRWFADALKAEPPRILVVEPQNQAYVSQAQSLGWEAFPSEDPRFRAREDPRAPNDLCDSALYGFTKVRSYWPEDLPTTGAQIDDGERPPTDGWQKYT